MKLERLGIRGKALDWLHSYLIDRRQCVKIDNSISEEHKINFGVPQGSILGPTLFTIYMNDIFQTTITNADLICYADDTVILFHGTDWQQVYKNAEIGLNNIANWLDNNLLTLNVTKTKYISFRKTKATKIPTRTLSIHDNSCYNRFNNNESPCPCSVINRVEEIKYLGVIIDEHLSFGPQIELRVLTKRPCKLIYVMKMIRNSAPTDVKKLVYIALCQSLLTYCINTWGGAAKTFMLNLERAQRAVIKTLLNKPYRYSTEKLYSEASLLGIRKLYILNITAKTHIEILNRTDLNMLQSKRKFRVPVPAVNSAYAQRHPYFLHPFLYNAVNKLCNIGDCSRYQTKKKLKSWLLTIAYEETEAILEIKK